MFLWKYLVLLLLIIVQICKGKAQNTRRRDVNKHKHSHRQLWQLVHSLGKKQLTVNIEGTGISWEVHF